MHRLTGPVTEPFDCGVDELNDFLTRAWDQQQSGFSVTYLLHVKGILAGFISVAMSKIPLDSSERPTDSYTRELPALNLVQMAVSKEFHRMGYGKFLVSAAIFLAQSSTAVGCRYVQLDARYAEGSANPYEIRDFYADRGFVENKYLQNQREKDAKNARPPRDPKKINISMRFDLRPPDGAPVLPPLDQSFLESRNAFGVRKLQRGLRHLIDRAMAKLMRG